MPLVSGIVAPFWGMLADRFGRRIMLQRSLFGFAVCLGAMGLATEPWHLLAIRAVEGLFGGFMASAAALISTTSPPERVSIGIGRTHAARVLGMAAGPIPGGLMADYAGYRPACFAAMAFAFAAFVIVTLFTRETVRRALQDATTEIVSLRRVITSGAFLSVFGAILVTRMAERTFDPVLPLLVAQTTDGTAVASATSAIAASGLLASGVAAAVIGHLVAGKASRTLFILLVLTAAAFAPIAFIPGWWPLLGFRIATGLLLGASFTIALSLVALETPLERRSAALGIIGSGSSYGSALGFFLAGILSPISLTSVFLADSLLILAAAVLFALGRGWLRRQE